MERKNREDSIVTLFFQGNMAARNQGAKYTGPNGIKVLYKPTNTVYTSRIPNAPLLFYNPYLYDELKEIVYGMPWNPLFFPNYLISFVIQWYFNIIGSPAHHVDLFRLNVGGPADVSQHQTALKNCIHDNPGKKIVLFGTSRGAATTFVSVSLLPPELRSKICLVVVEAPFDTVPNVLEKTAYVPAALQLFLLTHLCQYSPSQLTPLDAADNFPLDIPIAFITSEVDSTVPYQCTKNVIRKLKNRNHKNIHHLKLKKSGHSTMSLHNEEDVNNYKIFMNDLYEKYIDGK